MIGLGTIVNVVAVLIGATIGLIIKGGLPSRFEKTVMTAIGLATLFIGINGTLSGMLVIGENGSISSQHTMLLIASLVIGAVIGELIDIEKHLDNLGEWCKRKFKFQGEQNATFVEGFVSSSLLFCVGAMTIVGALEDGLNGNPSMLYAKSLMDGISAIVFTASLGVGVYFSIITVIVYQGGITLLARLIQPLLSDALISQMSLVGSVLIFAIGINLIFGKKVKTGNLLPAILVPIFWNIIQSFL